MMQELKRILSEILSVIPKGSKICYLDYPIHGNVGDLLICSGTERWFEENNMNVIARYNLFNFPYEKKLTEDTIIVFHGGGNFGDYWYYHEQFREKIIDKYKNNRIVILPQTIHFNNTGLLEHARKIINAHPEIYIFARDNDSYKFAKSHFNGGVFLCPDMAHQLWPLPKTYNGELFNQPLIQMRNDKEANMMHQKKFDEFELWDWDNLWDDDEKRMLSFFSQARFLEKVPHQFINDSDCSSIIKHYGWGELLEREEVDLSSLWYKFMFHLIDRSVIHFSKHSKLITSRLHGHILACLLSMENSIIDNNYGKIGSYYNTWTNRIVAVTLLENK